MSERNHAVSVRARLLNRARRDGEDFQRLLMRFAIERLLYRLSKSSHADAFVLKGATLFALWFGKPHRATKDLDLLGRGAPDLQRLIGVFQEVVEVSCPEDGIVFDPEAIVGAPIREEALYSGIRAVVPGHLSGARFKVQVDIGMGDSVVPEPVDREISSLLDLPTSAMRTYAKETVVAEKLEALVILGMTTSRMKDLYDLDLLRRAFEFDDVLVESVRSTFARRGTAIPKILPVGLSDEFAEDQMKQVQWHAFLRKSGGDQTLELARVVGIFGRGCGRCWWLPLQSA